MSTTRQSIAFSISTLTSENAKRFIHLYTVIIRILPVCPGAMFRVRRTGGFWDWNWTRTIMPCLSPSPAVSSECHLAAAANTEPVKSKQVVMEPALQTGNMQVILLLKLQ